METKAMTKAAVRQLVSSPAAPAEGSSLIRIIERASQDEKFDVAKLQALLEMQERWSKEEARKAFVVALTNFKADPPEVLKTKHVSYGAAGGKTSYNHADLAGASAQIGAALSVHGLSHRWNVEQTKEGRISVTCILMHVLGHSESVRMESAADQSGGKNNIQAIGSATSYLQRYTLFAAAGVIAKEQGDDDGRATGPTGPVAGPKVKESAPAAPAEQKEFADRAPNIPEGCDGVQTFVPAEVSKKEGDTKGKKWTKYGIKGPDGAWYGTFDSNFSDLAEEAKIENYAITVGYKIDGKWYNVVTLEKAAL